MAQQKLADMEAYENELSQPYETGRFDDEETDQTARIDFPALVSKFPCGKYDVEHVEERKKVFELFDRRGNCVLTLLDVESGLYSWLGSSFFGVDGRTLISAIGPAISRAFHAARGSSGRRALSSNESKVDETITAWQTFLIGWFGPKMRRA